MRSSQRSAKRTHIWCRKSIGSDICPGVAASAAMIAHQREVARIHISAHMVLDELSFRNACCSLRCSNQRCPPHCAWLPDPASRVARRRTDPSARCRALQPLPSARPRLAWRRSASSELPASLRPPSFAQSKPRHDCAPPDNRTSARIGAPLGFCHRGSGSRASTKRHDHVGTRVERWPRARPRRPVRWHILGHNGVQLVVETGVLNNLEENWLGRQDSKPKRTGAKCLILLACSIALHM